MTTLDPRPLPADVRVAVVGSGFAGLGTAIALRGAGRHDFVVLERAEDVGGTWRDNAYPGCACDVPSHLYSFSFAPNPDWTRSFSSQPEIQAYLQRTAREHGVLPHLHTGVELLEARWDDAERRWHLRTSRGALTCEVLVAGTGALSEPSVPDLPGRETSRARRFHSAAWRHDHDLTGERVAVIGTGASAVQFVPHVQRAAAHLTLFQRTRALGPAPPRPGHRPARAGAVPARSPRCRRPPAAASTPCARAGCSASATTSASCGWPSGRPAASSPSRSPTPSCARS